VTGSPRIPGFARLAVLAAAVLLLGQGAALHHRHEIAADCPPGPCREHGSHEAALGASGTSVSVADACPFCELLGQGRAAAPSATAALAPLAAPTATAPPHAGDAPTAPPLEGRRARAPPRRA